MDAIKVGDKCTICRQGHGLPARVGVTVRVMALAEGWAMVRYPRAMPFVVSVKELAKGVQQSVHRLIKGSDHR